MRIAITGATGYIGMRLVRAAHRQGHSVLALTRRDPGLAGWRGCLSNSPTVSRRCCPTTSGP
ncbi:MAG: NmrA family NAD(P)-binding protein [Burkholderiaceae bacterium]